EFIEKVVNEYNLSDIPDSTFVNIENDTLLPANYDFTKNNHHGIFYLNKMRDEIGVGGFSFVYKTCFPLKYENINTKIMNCANDDLLSVKVVPLDATSFAGLMKIHEYTNPDKGLADVMYKLLKEREQSDIQSVLPEILILKL